MPNKSIKAAILDLDGVITQTAALHAKAWKKMFDAYNEQRKKNGKEPYKEFSIENDYPEYVDGMPRYDGVENFLKSRDVDLPRGNSEDDPDKETICGLGNRKNDLYLKMVDNEGVEVLKKNVNKIREWKKNGMKTAIISSSRNCRKILKVAGLQGLFDVRVDGVVSEERNLKGKPEPDIFLSAAGELGFSPQESLIVEDSLAGMKAGKKGNFEVIIGIAEGEKVKKMKEKGATHVVKNLEDLSLDVEPRTRSASEIPDAMDNFNKITADWNKNSDRQTGPCIFLDYDGTLTPIVEEYNKAYLSDDMRNVIRELSELRITAVVSGRGMEDVKERVNLNNIYYAGSHGFEMSGPGNFSHEIEAALKLIPVLDKTEKKLKDNLKDIEGVKFERKKFALAVHYRQVSSGSEESVKKQVNKILGDVDELTQGRGKKVIEVKPNLYWNKGKAINHLMKQLDIGQNSSMLYIGDDITDEDAFMQIRNGSGILVGDHHEKSYADYHLKNVEEVKNFLKAIILFFKVEK